MLTVMECANCGQRNQIDMQSIKNAICGGCKEKLIDDDVVLAELSQNEIVAAIEGVPTNYTNEEVNTTNWVSKIGDYHAQEEYVNKGFWSKVRKYAAKVPFAIDAVAMYYCAMDANTPSMAKATAIGALAYWILPIDLIPDFVPIVGFADDATAILIAYKAISNHITEEHRQKAKQFFEK